MDLLEEIVIGNFGTWVILVCLFLILIDKRLQDHRVNLLFFIFWGILLLNDVADILDFYLSSLDTLNNWRYVTSMIGYVSTPAMVMMFIFILFRREKKNMFLWAVFIPLAVEVILVVISPWTHVVFSFNAGNHFLRGPLGYLPHVTSAIYLATLLILTFVFSSRFDKMELFTVCLVSGIALLATLIESITEYQFLVPSALSVSCLVYLFYFYLSQSRVDQLTGLYNRNCFFSDTSKINKVGGVLISVDLNGLKNINDSSGHSAGDEALSTLSQCLLKASSKGFLTYRTGGDEFVVMGLKKNEKDAEEYIDKAKGFLAKTAYMASFGYSLFKGDAAFDESLKKSDEAMYLDKEHYKHR